MTTWYAATPQAEADRALAAWPEMPIENLELCSLILGTAREQVAAYAPAFTIPDPTGSIVLGPPTVMTRNLFSDPSVGAPGATSVLRTNWCRNGSFEIDASLWQATFASATLARSTAQKYSGTASLAVTTLGTVTGEGAYSSTYTVPGAGLVHSVGSRVLAPAGAAMEILAASTGGGMNVAARFTGTGSWQLVAANGAATGTSRNPYVVVRTSTASGAVPQAITFYLDEVITETTAVVGKFFDGAAQGSPDPDFSTRWIGVAGQSASELTAEVVPGVTAVDCWAVRSGIWAADGNKSMRTIPTGPNPTVTIANLPGGNTMLATRRDPSDVLSEIRENINGPAVLRPSATQDTWYDQLGIFAGDYSGLWFDGDTAQRMGRTYAWEGGVNASPSTETYQPNVFVPDPPQIPDRLVYAQLQQARNLWNAGRAGGDGDIGAEGFTFTPRPLDKTIRDIIRPRNVGPYVL